MESIFKSFILIVLFLANVLDNVNAQNPNWAPPNGTSFQFSANVIAQIKLSDIVSENSNDVIAFFEDGEMRGLSTAVSLGNGLYRHFVTLYSHQPLDTFNIKVYHQNTGFVYEVQQAFIFQAQIILGSIDQPYIVNIYPDNDAPIHLLPIPQQQTVQGLAFLPIDLLPYLIQPDSFPVDWSFSTNSNLTVNLQGTMLLVSGAPGFIGQTQLTVRATEQGLSMLLENSHTASRSAQTNAQFAEVTIIFIVAALYPSPLWHPAIPSQGIITGEMFDTIPLHDFENQFQGPFIRYDYAPIIIETVPPVASPSWAVTQTFGTTMNIIAQVNYTPKYQFNHVDDKLVAFIGNEIRGVAQKNAVSGLYYLSIGGENINGAVISLKLYSGDMKNILVIDSAFLYKPYTILGSYESPFMIDFAPIIPIEPDSLVANGIYFMPITITNPNFLGTVTFTFYALDPTYPDYIQDKTNATFCIVADSTQLNTYYLDLDGDGLGNPLFAIKACELPTGYVDNNSDCNDEDSGNAGTIVTITENSGIPNDGHICPSATTTLSVVQNGQFYLWNTGQTTQSIIVSPASTIVYTVTVSSGVICIDTTPVTINVEGKVVVNNSNAGFGSLRNVLECALEGDSITYDYPLNNQTILTEPLEIQKNITIIGTLPAKPEIALDFNIMSDGFILDPNKSLNLDNIDIKILNQSIQNTFSGIGQVVIIGSTKIFNE